MKPPTAQEVAVAIGVQVIPKLKFPVPSPLNAPLSPIKVTPGTFLSDTDGPTGTVEFEVLVVRRPRHGKTHCDIDGTPNLGRRHGAKWRSTTSIPAVIGGQQESIRRCRDGSVGNDCHDRELSYPFQSTHGPNSFRFRTP
jgi:hypothetical protein